MAEPELDPDGHLKDPDAWTPAFASACAAADGITLEAEHWAVLAVLREHHAIARQPPPMRLLLRLLVNRLGPDFQTSRRLYRLFPDAPLRRACRYAGLPRPASCI